MMDSWTGTMNLYQILIDLTPPQGNTPSLSMKQAPLEPKESRMR